MCAQSHTPATTCHCFQPNMTGRCLWRIDNALKYCPRNFICRTFCQSSQSQSAMQTSLCKIGLENKSNSCNTFAAKTMQPWEILCGGGGLENVRRLKITEYATIYRNAYKQPDLRNSTARWSRREYGDLDAVTQSRRVMRRSIAAQTPTSFACCTLAQIGSWRGEFYRAVGSGGNSCYWISVLAISQFCVQHPLQWGLFKSRWQSDKSNHRNRSDTTLQKFTR